MRKKQKQGSRFRFGILGLFLIGIAFGGCEKELFEDSLYKDKMTIKKVSFEEFKRNLKAHEKFKTIREGTRSDAMMARYEYNEEYGVYFDPDNIKLITKDNLKNYTIPLLKEPNDSLIKNLVLSEKPDLSYSAKILGYKLTDEEIELIKQGINPNLTNKIYEKRIDGGSNVSNSYSNLCGLEINFTYVPNYCCDGIHYYGQPCNYDGTDCSPPPFSVIIEVVYVLCPEESVGGPTPPPGPVNPTNPPTDPGGGIGDGSNPDVGVTTPINNEAEEEIITTPVVPGLASDTPEIDDPCAKLKVLLTNDGLNLSAEIDYLKNKINNPSNKNEHAVTIIKRLNQETGNTEYRPMNRVELGPNGGKMETIDNIIGFVHCHTPKGYSMFSFEDVNTLKFLYNAIGIPQRKKQSFLMLVAKDRVTDSIKTYSIVVEDIDKLMAGIETKLNSPELDYIDLLPLTPEKKQAKKLEELTKFQGMDCEDNNYLQEDLELNFLQKFATFGISIYKANPDLNNWIKLELPEDPGSTHPKKTNCN